MRSEHTQMRQLLKDLSQAPAGKDRDGYLGLSETLMIIMQQHNMKEEQMLYRMADQVFASSVEAVLERMGSV
jgi:hemerythrin-like domain-containing protein